MDILQPLPYKNWSLLLDVLKQDWPHYAYYYNWIVNAIRWKNKDPTRRHKILCPFGEHTTGVFVGLPGFTLQKIVVFSVSGSKSLLMKALMETKVIDWNQECFIFASVHENITDVVLKVINEKNSNLMVDKWEMGHYFKSKEECKKLKFDIPDDCELKYLNKSHMPLVASKWHLGRQTGYRYALEIVTDYVTLNRGLGLFSKADNYPMSWATHTEWSGIGTLGTLEDHMGKGYGKIMAKVMAKEIAQKENLDSSIFIVKNNVPSIKIFLSLGYRLVSNINWLVITQKKNSKL